MSSYAGSVASEEPEQQRFDDTEEAGHPVPSSRPTSIVSSDPGTWDQNAIVGPATDTGLGDATTTPRTSLGERTRSLLHEAGRPARASSPTRAGLVERWNAGDNATRQPDPTIADEDPAIYVDYEHDYQPPRGGDGSPSSASTMPLSSPADTRYSVQTSQTLEAVLTGSQNYYHLPTYDDGTLISGGASLNWNALDLRFAIGEKPVVKWPVPRKILDHSYPVGAPSDDEFTHVRLTPITTNTKVALESRSTKLGRETKIVVALDVWWKSVSELDFARTISSVADEIKSLQNHRDFGPEAWKKVVVFIWTHGCTTNVRRVLKRMGVFVPEAMVTFPEMDARLFEVGDSPYYSNLLHCMFG
jgi:hypothetical protein